ncbi:MCE family protein [Aquihabitans sp. G128]|uniref:MCE family protein n=1 Tax=Aquihabitans sp. G128 TaxID=2849779 RepID=UPI001C218612|nr:MCE family protein [Aquihabitans sp. G128]QXC61955.1 MCE family protein [Aquihabitans sp. G128]
MTAHRLRRRAAALLVVLAVGVVLPACSLVDDGGGGARVSADFTRGTGLYPGSPVRVLGIDVGKVTKVENQGGHVHVELELDEGAKVPKDAHATIVPLTLLGERYIQMGPAYTSGPTLGDGDDIPLARTTVPAEIDELLRGLQDFIGAIDPKKASSVVTNLAEVLDGQGKTLNDLIGNAAGTLDLLADKGDDLRSIITSLGDLTETLRGRTDSIESLIQNYDLVTQVLIDNKDDLDATITQLDRAATELTALLLEHEKPLKADVDVVTKAGATIDANTTNIKTTLSATVDLFAAAKRAYDGDTNSLALNNQLNPGLTSDLIAGRFRDRIAGLCRRLGIDLCSDQGSPLLNDLVGLLPGLLGDLANGTPLGSPTTPAGKSQAPAPTTTAPPTTPTVPPLPTGPTPDELLAALSKQITGGLDQAQADLLGQLDLTRLGDLLALDPVLLQVLPELDQQQLDLIRTVDVADLPQTLLDLTNLLHPPKDRLTPLLPSTPTTTAPPKGGGGLSIDGIVDTLTGLLGGGK